MARRYYSSTAARTTLASGVDDTTNTFTVNAVSGWPTSTPYTLIIDQDTVNEEIVEVTGRTGTTITVTRGVDGTSAVAHSSGAAVNHGVSARDFDEPNAFINGTGTVTETMLASNAVTSAKILDGTIVNADINASAAIAQSKIADLTSDLASKVDYALPVNAQTGTTYTFVAADAEKLTTASNAAAVTLTIPPQSSVAWGDNTVLRVVNYGAGAVTVAGGSGVTVTNTATTLAQYQAAAAIRTGSDAWTLVPFSGGTSELTSADVSATTGSPSTGTFTDGGVSYTFYKWTATGSITFSDTGFIRVFVVGGGGGGGSARSTLAGKSGGGGGGGAAVDVQIFVEAEEYAIAVGAGGAGSTAVGVNGLSGNSSVACRVGAVGGGGGGSAVQASPATENSGSSGASGGGGTGAASGTGGSGGSPIISGTTGFAGGSGQISGDRRGGGGGGMGAAGVNGASTGNGGAGITRIYDAGSSIGYAGGGGGGATSGSAGSGTDGGGNGAVDGHGSAAAANRGGGGGGGNGATNRNGGNGGSGVAIIVLRTAA